MVGIIYKATNLINGKIYIGQTKRSLEERIDNHYKCKKNYQFANALKKYGLKNFRFEIIKETNNLSEEEIFFIKKFNSYIDGYNMTEGGETSPMLIPEIAKKVSKTKRGVPSPFRGIKRPEMMGDNNPSKKLEVRQKLSESKKGSLNPNFGKHLEFSKERNQKISQKLKGRKFTEEHKRNISKAAKKRKHIRDKNGRFISGGGDF